jgi:excisionase family DNA binding protein
MKGSMSAAPEYVSARRAGQLAGCSAKTVRRWIAAGQLRAVKRGRSFRIALADLARLAELPAGPSGDAPSDAPPGTGSEASALVHELLAELLRATAAAARWRTLAEILLVQLEEAEQGRAVSGTSGADQREAGRPRVEDLPRSGAWRALLGAVGEPTTAATWFAPRGASPCPGGDPAVS